VVRGGGRFADGVVGGDRIPPAFPPFLSCSSRSVVKI
jgi:hypothetical protein